MLGTVLEKNSRFIKCPQCGDTESFDVTEVQPSELFGSWLCDTCGTVISGFRNADDTFEIEAKFNYAVPTLALLKLPPQKTPIFFVLSRRMSREMLNNRQPIDEMEFIHSPQFIFNYEIDPSFLLADTVKIIKDGEPEPRDVFELSTIKEFDSLGQSFEEATLDSLISDLFGEIVSTEN